MNLLKKLFVRLRKIPIQKGRILKNSGFLISILKVNLIRSNFSFSLRFKIFLAYHHAFIVLLTHLRLYSRYQVLLIFESLKNLRIFCKELKLINEKAIRLDKLLHHRYFGRLRMMFICKMTLLSFSYIFRPHRWKPISKDRTLFRLET